MKRKELPVIISTTMELAKKVMAKLNETAEICKANEAKMEISTLQGFKKVAAVGETYVSAAGIEFKVLEIASNLIVDGKRQGLQMNFEINGEATGLKRLESLSKLVGLQWERVARTEKAYNPGKFKIRSAEELAADANKMALDFANNVKKMQRLEEEIAEFSNEYGVGSLCELEYNTSKILSVLELRNAAAKAEAAEAAEKAAKAKAVKDAANGKTKTELASETLALKAANAELVAKLAAMGVDVSALGL